MPELEFSYAEVGATSGFDTSLSQRLRREYDLDHHEFVVGSGRELYQRAVESMFQWRHFEIPWLELNGACGRVEEGQVVATLVRAAGLWSLNPCRVVYVERSEGSVDRAAFAYGTLPGHAERGEERFQLSFNEASGEVKYEIAAFSRPAILLSRLGYPFARRLQRRFAAASARALARAAASACELGEHHAILDG